MAAEEAVGSSRNSREREREREESNRWRMADSAGDDVESSMALDSLITRFRLQCELLSACLDKVFISSSCEVMLLSSSH